MDIKKKSSQSHQLDIFPEDPLPLDLELIPCSQSGGWADNIIEHLNTTDYKCLEGKLNGIEYLFILTNDNTEHKYQAYYKATGSFTVVIFIKQLKPTNSNTIVLRISDIPINKDKQLKPAIFKEIVSKYKEDKKLISEHMMRVYYYGDLKANYNFTPPLSYTIVKKYNVLTEISYSNSYLRDTILRQLLKMLIKLNENKIFHNDLKPTNIGYDEKGTLILIDWDNTTLAGFNWKEWGKPYNRGRTYNPYYFEEEKFEDSMFDKINCLSLGIIIGDLFFKYGKESYEIFFAEKFYEKFPPYVDVPFEAVYQVNSIYELDGSYFDNKLRNNIMLELLKKEYKDILTYEKTLTIYDKINPIINDSNDYPIENKNEIKEFSNDKIFYLRTMPDKNNIKFIKETTNYTYYAVNDYTTFPYIYPNNIAMIYDKNQFTKLDNHI